MFYCTHCASFRDVGCKFARCLERKGRVEILRRAQGAALCEVYVWLPQTDTMAKLMVFARHLMRSGGRERGELP